MREKKPCLRYGLIIFFIFLSILILSIILVNQSPLSGKVILDIPPHTSFSSIVDALKDKGVIRSKSWFYLIASLRFAQGRIKAGEYEFSEGMSSLKVLDMLISGKAKLYSITVIPGANLRQVAKILEKRGGVSGDRFLALCYDKDFINSLGIYDAPSLEGYIFPDTYFFSKYSKEEDILRTMVKKMQSEWKEEFEKRAGELNLTFHQVLTLASIIEKETGCEEEKPLISSVFHNRLKKGMPLYSDPTVIYGIENFDGNLRRKDLARSSPYNTYLNPGLPPGPIASPGISSIRSALYPADSDYLYFVSMKNGRHYFSKSYKDHKKAVRRYQLGGN